jgi:elongator complex protein 2
MIIWTPQTQGLGGQDVWLPDQRFGELGAGRSLGMFGAIWAVPIGKEEEVSVITNSWSGGLQRWRREHNAAGEEDWIADLAPTGHALPVKDLAWDPSGSFLVSVSTDQTSRIHAPCRSAVQKSASQPPVWGELGRPQVHGYDMTCVDFLGRLRFASGADEKVIRVFDAPKGFAGSLFALGVTEDDLTEVGLGFGKRDEKSELIGVFVECSCGWGKCTATRAV